jgi:mismatch-specific thymine-DNA glycosylase
MVPDVLAEGVSLIFVGYNPGRASEATGHHFAGPGNYFWPLLYEAGLTPRRLRPADDRDLLLYGIGITNVVDRPTPGTADLSAEELWAGAVRLRQKIQQLRPRVLCLLGKDVYRAYAQIPRHQPVAWGLAPTRTVPGVLEFVAPNPSRRATMPYGERLRWMRELAGLCRYGPGPT